MTADRPRSAPAVTPCLGLLVVFALLSMAGSVNAQERNEALEQECASRLAESQRIASNQYKLRKLIRLVAECEDHAPTHVALAGQYSKMRLESEPDWPLKGLTHYGIALELDPNNVEAHWGAGQLWQYSGVYDRAILHYRWILDSADNSQVGPRKRDEADTYIRACRFLVITGKKPKRQVAQPSGELSKTIEPSRPQVEAAPITKEPESAYDDLFGQGAAGDPEISDTRLLAQTDLSAKAIEARSGWSFLEKLAGSVAVASGVHKSGGDDRHIQTALSLLTDWAESPTDGRVDSRNRFITGIIGVLGSAILDLDLASTINPMLERDGFEPVAPELLTTTLDTSRTNPGLNSRPSAQTTMTDEFDNWKPEPGKQNEFEIGDLGSIEIVSSAPDLSGMWTARYYDCHGSTSYSGQRNPYTTEYETHVSVRLVHNANEVVMSYSTNDLRIVGNSEQAQQIRKHGYQKAENYSHRWQLRESVLVLHSDETKRHTYSTPAMEIYPGKTVPGTSGAYDVRTVMNSELKFDPDFERAIGWFKSEQQSSNSGDGGSRQECKVELVRR